MNCDGKRIAVAIPCYNEAVTIAKVVRDFKAIFPNSVYVFDNNSIDGSAGIAKDAGAIVHYIKKRGKGNVMRAIFDTVMVDALVVVDGDDTYIAEESPMLVEPVLRGEADMVVGNRLHNVADESLCKLHRVGNRLIVASINRMFNTNYHDILSGYRVFSRRFIESVSIFKEGFETETEITLQALENGLEVIEKPISYRSRPPSSQSKLRSFRDGYRIMFTSLGLLRDHQPMRLFGYISILCLLFVFLSGTLRLINYLGISTLPTPLLTGMILLFVPVGTLSFGIGLVLSAVNSRFREIKHQIIKRNRQNNV